MPLRSYFGVSGKTNEHSLKEKKAADWPHGKLLPMGYNYLYKETTIEWL